jgi:protein involved in polysaccharide export with SLBB domain
MLAFRHLAHATPSLLLALCVGCASVPDVEGIRVRDVTATGTTPVPDAAAPAEMPPPRQNSSGVLRPGDQVDVVVWGYDDLSRRITVSGDGRLPYALVGDIAVGGKTAAQAQDLVRDGLRPLVRDPLVRISVAVPAPARCQVLGEVQRPGLVALPSAEATLLEALAAAGGLSETARQRVLLVREHEGKVYLQGLDYRALVSGEVARRHMLVGDGDMLFVPAARMVDTAREARRLSDILSPFLTFQQITLLFDPFLRALLHGEGGTTNTIVVPQP